MNKSLVFVFVATALSPASQPTRSFRHHSANPTLDSGPIHLVRRVPFTLRAGARHWWRRELPPFLHGELVVLRARANEFTPRAVGERVLFGGSETVQRLGHSLDGRIVVGVLPYCEDNRNEARSVSRAPRPFFFGDRGLPEHVTRTSARAALKHALSNGLASSSDVAWESVAEAHAMIEDEGELHEEAATWLEHFAPESVDQIRTLRGQ